MVGVLHREQVRAAVGRSSGPADWKLHRKERPLSRRYVTGILGSVTLAVAVPDGEELLRCIRTKE
jgi:hypothetical protein